MMKISDVINPVFHEFWSYSKKHEYLRYVLKGGRSSAKSTHIGFRIVMDVIKYPITALCVRKVKDTLSESVYEQLKECINILGVEQYFDFRVSPLQIIYKPRGNKIIFRGADDPQKIKSLKVAKFPVADLWIEELAEFKNEDEITTIEQSVLRAELPKGLYYSFFYSYNPPKRKQSWVNKKFNISVKPANTYIHHSTYLDNPHISKETVSEADEMKEKNPLKYRWIFLGEPIGSGVVPFSNLVFRKITDEEVASFDNIRQGNDWGYATDPLAFVRLHYDKTRRKIYFIDEIYGVKLFNRELADRLKKKGYDKMLTIADSAEPKSISEMKCEYDCNFKGAKKGPGSVEYGENWLDDLEEIVIDVNRTPNVAREFESIDYQTDRDGNAKAKLEDKDNHTIDATRYALENDMKKSKGLSVLK
ncbi:MAG: PBSX family phage terminase large subunit [Eubacterium sp.]|nr:PBSX family phage terminase large subunit [Eubacterium sp.]